MAEQIVTVLLYLLGIISPLIYSLFKETRFTKKGAIITYGSQMVIFTIGSFFVFDNSMHVVLLISALIGFAWIMIGTNMRKKTASVFFSFKTIASWQIPVVLVGYKVWFWKTIGLPFVVTTAVLLIGFYTYSFIKREK